MDIKGLLIIMVMLFGAGTAHAQKSYNALMYEGNKLFEEQKFEAAASRFMEAATRDEGGFDAAYNLGNALYKSGMYAEAAAEYEKANKAATTLQDKAAVLHNLGNAAMQMEQPDKAAEYYKQSLKQEPGNEATRKNYEIAKLKEKQQEQQQQNGGGGGEGQQKQDQQGAGEEQKDGAGGTGKGPENEGDNQDGNRTNNNKDNTNGALPEGTQNAILNRVSDKERETAKRILNKNSYSMPESNEKDW
ncbi:tetratricopeptide repeat protein [Chryseobacterium sp. MFBS3-17]|uniref:tetratricopeptide repeat protein n=1 Tax=Chryseobacterium sp. MFBS3-17 TaxID=2886689 RepID=UPI001D0E0F1A|nr:tetratricopeptide repeat protein [Chryseobacterium sp. MFBS3-17]MCC2590232.1 tetratricopeptide repeat protein [Chryseobacterium sp. MFBS3-17]